MALLTIVHEIRKNMEEVGVLKREELKVIYVAPMKALAQEIVGKFKERLSRLGLIVRELTGGRERLGLRHRRYAVDTSRNSRNTSHCNNT